MQMNCKELFFSMRFVRETHSIEVVMVGSHGTTKSKQKLCWRRVQTSLLPRKQKKDKEESEALSEATKGMLRARSESECEYSPQKRNTYQMLQKRGIRQQSYKRRFHQHRKTRYTMDPQIDFECLHNLICHGQVHFKKVGIALQSFHRTFWVHF